MNLQPLEPPDPLDDLLMQARWPEPSPQALRRLEKTWDAITPRRRWRLQSLAMAAAALIIICSGLAIVLHRPPMHQPVVIIVNPPQPEKVVAPASYIPRAPTPLERLAIDHELARPPMLPVKQAVVAVDGAVVELFRDPRGDVSSIVTDLQGRVSTEIMVGELRHLAIDPQNPARASAIRLLSATGSRRATAFLLPLLQEPDVRAETMAAICRVADSATLWRLIPTAKSDGECSQLIAAALRRDAPGLMPRYLRLVDNAGTRDAALAALDQMEHPPVQELIAALGGAHVSDRFAAARALGHIDGPHTTAELVIRVEQNVTRRECLAALLLSRGEEAKDAVAEAKQSPMLCPIVNAVSLDLQQLN